MAYSEESYKCRAEMNSQARQIVLQDGTSYLYSSLIYCPLTTPDIEPGTNVLVLDQDGKTRIEGKVAGFTRDQFHCRIWV